MGAAARATSCARASCTRWVGRRAKQSLHLFVREFPSRWPSLETPRAPLRTGPTRHRGSQSRLRTPKRLETRHIRCAPQSRTTIFTLAVENHDRVPRNRQSASPSNPSRARVSHRPKPASCRGCHTVDHVPPSWFLTTSAACASRDPRSLLHLPADHEVHWVASAALTCLPATFEVPTASDPSERSPPPQLRRRHRLGMPP